MKKIILSIVIVFVGLLSYAQNTTISNNIIARNNLQLGNRNITTFQTDTNFTSNNAIPTSLAIKNLLDGRPWGGSGGSSNLTLQEAIDNSGVFNKDNYLDANNNIYNISNLRSWQLQALASITSMDEDGNFLLENTSGALSFDNGGNFGLTAKNGANRLGVLDFFSDGRWNVYQNNGSTTTLGFAQNNDGSLQLPYYSNSDPELFATFDGSGNLILSSLPSSPTNIAQNGNSFGEAVVIGSTDDNSLKFITNNTNSGIINSLNVGFGWHTLQNNTTGAINFTLGDGTLTNNTDGYGNVALGSLALSIGTSNVENIAIGRNSLRYAEAAFNIGIGTNALQSVTGSSNIGIGMSALQANTTGNYNTTLGNHALYNSVDGSYNIAIGAAAGRYITGMSNLIILNSLDRGNMTNDTLNSPFIVFQNTNVLNQRIKLNGNLHIPNGASSGYVLTSDADGIGSWQTGGAIASGGTGGTATPTAGGVAYGTGTAYAFTSAGTAGQFLISTGTTEPIFTPAAFVTASSVSFGLGALSSTFGTATDNVAIGNFAGFNVGDGKRNVEIGGSAGYSHALGNGNIAIGFYSSHYSSGSSTTSNSISNELIINNYDAGSRDGDTTKSIIYGLMSTSAAAQRLRVNAVLQTNIAFAYGTATPDASTAFDIISTTKGLGLPAMTKTQRDAIVTPRTGLAIYQTDNTPGLRVYNGTNWIKYSETTD